MLIGCFPWYSPCRWFCVMNVYVPESSCMPSICNVWTRYWSCYPCICSREFTYAIHLECLNPLLILLSTYMFQRIHIRHTSGMFEPVTDPVIHIYVPESSLMLYIWSVWTRYWSCYPHICSREFTYAIHLECLNTLLILLSMQMFQPTPAAQTSQIYAAIMQGRWYVPKITYNCVYFNP